MVSKVVKVQRARTREQARQELIGRGESIASWAARHQISKTLVSEVLRGKRRCLRGESHRAAVLLGIKAGTARTLPAKPGARDT